MRIGILGAGLAGISLAQFLDAHDPATEIELLEKASQPGGLCQSFRFGPLHYDVGPHILFSKDAEVLQLMVDLLGDNVQRLRRSNKIFHDGRLIKYPFENELSALSDADKQYCLDAFLNNPYRSYQPASMLQFFLVTFGEGITNLYLRPYNEKIWKFDPAMMDTQMVDRIPKPPAEDIVKSAQGMPSEGYVHQLFFHYPKTGGIQTVVDGFRRRCSSRVALSLNCAIQRIENRDGRWTVHLADGTRREYNRLVSTIPIPDLVAALGPAVPATVGEAARALRFNSIAFCQVRVRRDTLGDHFAVMAADKQVLFHRLSKLDFLVPEEARDGTTTFQLEVTYRPGDRIDQMADGDLAARLVADLDRLGFARREDVLAHELRRFSHAYVIYDLDHRRNVETVRDYCENRLGIVLHGRFGEFKYMNMDAVIRRSIERSRQWTSQPQCNGGTA